MNLIQSELLNELGDSFLNYSLSVITDRALPDVRDGLKPVHRRILYAMHESGLFHNKSYKKSMATVGEVLKSYHPHGDSSVYDAMVRLAQDFSLRYPLIDGQGNMGSQDGDEPAAARYTEARLSKIASEMLRDIKKNVVDMKLNYSEDLYEPIVLPSRFPNILVNPTTGIAVGMACSFPSHNINDVVETIIEYINDNSKTNEDLFKILKGPDFPTGGIIINRDELLNGYSTGRGRVRVRGKYHLEKKGRKDIIVFTEIPYSLKKEKLLTDIVEMCKKKEIEGISDVHDESAEDMRFVIEVANGYDPESIVNILFAKSNLEDTISINFTCLVNGEPKTLSLKDIVKNYVEFQQNVIKRATEYDLKIVLKRLNIVLGLIIALANIDKVIAIIKGSESTTKAKESLISTFVLNEEQAKAILAMRLSSLTKLEVNELKAEKITLEKEKERLENILNNPNEIDKILIFDLKNISKVYGDNRRTIIEQITVAKTKKEKAEKVSSPVTIGIDQNLVVRSMDQKILKQINGTNMFAVKTTTTSSILAFGDDGKIYKIPVDGLSVGANLFKNIEAKPNRIIRILPSEKYKYVLIFTKNGYLKKSLFEEYSEIQRNATIGIKLKENDSVVDVIFINEEDIIIFSKKGMSIRISTKDISPVGRVALGVMSMKLKENDEISCATSVNNDTKYIASFSKMGQGKKTEVHHYPLQGRNGIGVIGHKIVNEKDYIVSAIAVKDDSYFSVFDNSKNKTFSSKEIPTLQRTSNGNITIKTDNLLFVKTL